MTLPISLNASASPPPATSPMPTRTGRVEIARPRAPVGDPAPAIEILPDRRRNPARGRTLLEVGAQLDDGAHRADALGRRPLAHGRGQHTS